jgi:hypothetical protein
MSFLIRAVLAAIALAVMAPPALAETLQERQERARQLYQQGQEHAQAGNYQAAIEVWLEAYEAQPIPLILFNVAQAYRQMEDCPSALYFYQRYLIDEPESQFSDVAAEHVGNLSRRCRAKSPWEGQDDGDDGGDGDGDGDGDSGDGGGAIEPVVPGPTQPTAPMAPQLLVAFVEGGPGFMSMGDLEVPVLFSIRAGVAYPLDLGAVELQAGATTTFTPVPYTHDGASRTALLTGILANAAARLPISPGLFARGELGLGAQVFSGITGANNVFMHPQRSTTGALSMFLIRTQLGAEYEITPNLVVSASPVVLSLSPPHSALRDDLGAFITRFEILAGLAVRL